MNEKNNKLPAHLIDVFNDLPINGFLRLKQIIGDKNSTPPIPAIIPVSAATWHRNIIKGIYPKGILLSPGIRGYLVEDIKQLLIDLYVDSR